MMTEIIIAIIGVISTVLAGVITYITTKKTNDALAENTSALTSLVNLDVYKDLVDSYREDFKTYKSENELEKAELKQQVTQMQGQMNFMNNKMMSMMGQICLDLSCKIRKEATIDLVESIKNECNDK